MKNKLQKNDPVISNLAKTPGLNHKKTVERFEALKSRVRPAMADIVAFGLFCWELKEVHLKHSQFAPWLKQFSPDSVQEHSQSGALQICYEVRSSMEVTKSVAEACGFQITDLVHRLSGQIRDTRGFGNCGDLMLKPAIDVPAEILSVREKISAVIEGKTKMQFMPGYKQAEFDADGFAHKKRGRLKGQGGATKEQRANAEELERQERITERKLKAEEIADWLIEMSDDAGFGEIAGTPELDVLDRAMEKARGYIKHHHA